MGQMIGEIVFSAEPATTARRSPPHIASPELRQVIASLIADSAVSSRATLCDVRAVVAGDGIFVSGEGELLHPQDRTFLVIELDEIIDRHGMSAVALDFTRR